MQNDYTLYVEENAPIGYAVGDIVASDPDSNKQLVYRILKLNGFSPNGEKITPDEVQ